MATPTNPSEGSRESGIIPTEWSAQAADAVVDAVALVRDKTTRPAQIAARGIVYGIVIAVLGVTALVLTVILLLRMYDNWVPGPLWIAYAALAGVFMIGGLLCFARANRPAPTV